MAKTALTNLAINSQRLWDSLMDTASIGGRPTWDIKHLTLADKDKRIRDWFRASCHAMFALHIEQGQALEAKEQGMLWCQVSMMGQDAHRRDPDASSNERVA